jgi:VWFA-related protein
MNRAWACLWALAAAVALTGAQEPAQQPTFKAGVQLVRIDVSVLDGKRQPVRGLQASDFTVLEDGQARPIRSFQPIDATATRAAMAPLPSHNVATNQIGDDTSRLIFILMDRSIPAERPMLIARQIADAAIDAMAPGDQAAIVTTGGGVPQNLTSDRDRLHKTVAATNWSETIPQVEKDNPVYILIKAYGLLDPSTDGACLCGVCAMDTIARIANDVRGVPRRKVLLFVGSDLIVQVGTSTWNRNLSCDKIARDSREKLFDALGSSGLTVHAIDPQGVASVGPATRTSVPNGIPGRDSAALNDQLTQERTDFMTAQGNLAVLPDLTGGRTILNSNEPFRMVPAVLHESDAYYLLAFEPIEGKGEVRHDIQVKVARKGVDVHTVRYLPAAASTASAAPTTTATAAPTPASAPASAPASNATPADTPAPPAPIQRALTGVVPDASLPLEMSVATFAGQDRAHSYVGVTLNASAFATTPGSIPLEIAVLASDEHGRTVGGARQNGTVQIPASAAGFAPFVELQTYLTLPPGNYELRSVVMHAGTATASSVFAHVTVPAFEDAPVALSDVVLGTRENAGALPDGAPAIPIVPTTLRSFRAGEPAWAFVRVYRRPTASAKAAPIGVELSVLDSSGKRVVHQSVADPAFAGSAADVRVPLPLKGLAAGSYTLRLDAKQGSLETSRTVAFSVSAAAAVLTQEHTPELDAAMAAAAAYVDGYERRITAIGAEEEYEQAVQQRQGTVVASGGRGGRGVALGDTLAATATRKTRAHVMTIGLGTRGWVSFRDVFELDGHAVHDSTERLSRILQNVNAESLEQARQIADESARYNLDPDAARLDRTINVPMTALHFIRAANQSRSVFRLGRPERIGGVDCVTLQFSEQSVPRLIGTRDNAAAQGTFWIDMANGGRVVRSELRMESVGNGGALVRSQTTVTYARAGKLDVWLPAVMEDSYDLPASRQTVTGHATYADFREFKVTTSADIK